MNALAAVLFLALATWSAPQTICGARIDPTRSVQAVNYAMPYSAARTWRGLSAQDLLARTILSEQGGLVLEPEYQIDAIGVAWVVLNRTRGGGDLYRVIVAPRQFLGMSQVGNAIRAADPESYSGWYGAQPHAGRLSYWTAYAISACVLGGHIPDLTRGALYFSHAYYVLDAQGQRIPLAGGGYVTEFYADGHARFRRVFDERSYRIDGRGPNWAELIRRAPKRGWVEVE